MIRRIAKRFNQAFMPVLTGFIVFSPFVTTLSLDILHLPIAIPELFFIVLITFQKEQTAYYRLDKNLFNFGIIVFSILFLIAVVCNKYGIGGIISVLRSYFYILLFYCIFKNKNNVNDEYIMWLCFGSLLGWYYDSSMNFLRLIVEMSAENVTYGMFLAIPLFLSIALSKKKYILLVLGLGLLTMTFVYAGIRRIIIVFLVSLLVISIFRVIGNIRRVFGVFIVGFLLLGCYYTFLPQIEIFMFDVSPQLHHRMFVRTEEALTGNATGGDKLRYQNISNLTDFDIESFIPHGFYTNHTSEVSAGIFHDLPIFGLIWTLGLPLAIMLIGSLLSMFIKAYQKYKIGLCPEAMPYLVTFVIMMALLFLDGTFLMFSYCAPITGLCLGKIDYFSNYKKYDEDYI